MDKEFNPLCLRNQICFPVYAAGNLILRKYKPYLDELDLTYTQYIVMMVLWEEGETNEKFLCETLFLKTNTLAPLLQKLEAKGYIKKEKDKVDERNLLISLTSEGVALREKALHVPECMAKELNLKPEEAEVLYRVLYKMLNEEKEKTL